jgi:hypothetical protein
MSSKIEFDEFSEISDRSLAPNVVDPVGHISLHLHCPGIPPQPSCTLIFPFFADGGNCFACFRRAGNGETLTGAALPGSGGATLWGGELLEDVQA